MIKFEASATTFLRGYGDISKLEGMATYRVGGASLCAQGITTWQTTQQLALCFVLWCHVDLGGVSRTFLKPEAQNAFGKRAADGSISAAAELEGCVLSCPLNPFL